MTHGDTRAPVNAYQVVNLTPPTLRAGCGGIDAYGGSFTFINEEQFRQMLRQIGANALGYAFKLLTPSPLFGQSLLEKFGLLMLGDKLLRRSIIQ